jgi:16S rRNA (cytosine967-C5)-methyltransferase
VDLCAGQGTKTRQLAAVFPTAGIIATDVDGARYRTLADFWRGNERVRVLPIDDAIRDASGRADLVLLDVPCSNTGVLARRVEAKYRCGRAQLDRLIAIQRQIIDRAVPLLSPSGRLLYSTCSIDADENHDQAEWAHQRHGLAIASTSSLLPRGLPGDDPTTYHDGSFSAVLARAH